MIYTQKSPALFIIGIIMLMIWFLADSSLLMPVIEHLANGKSYRYTSELITIPFYFGLIATAFGLWQWLGSHQQGHGDYYLSTIAGGMFILLITMLIRWFVAPEIAVISTQMREIGDAGK